MTKVEMPVVLDLPWVRGEVAWESYVDVIRLRLSSQAARRLARHLLLLCDEEGPVRG